MSTWWKKIFLAAGSGAVLSATTYFLLLGCGGAVKGDIRSERSMPVTLAPAGARLDDMAGSFALDTNNPIYLAWRSACPDKPTTANFEESLNRGAKVVRISHPGLTVPLYGLLALCELPYDYSGPASRSYQLEIPQNYVDATEGGRVSVVFEPFDYQGEQRIAWALWLSRDSAVFGAQAAPAASEGRRSLGGDVQKK